MTTQFRYNNIVNVYGNTISMGNTFKNIFWNESRGCSTAETMANKIPVSFQKSPLPHKGKATCSVCFVA